MNPIYQIIEIIMWFTVIVIIFAIIVFEIAVHSFIKQRGLYRCLHLFIIWMEKVRCRNN
jgi:hypothetical protein